MKILFSILLIGLINYSEVLISAEDVEKRVDDLINAMTVEEKVARIKQLNCSHFIDDLLKVLSHSCFPRNTLRILYKDNPSQESSVQVDFAGNWISIMNYILSEENRVA